MTTREKALEEVAQMVAKYLGCFEVHNWPPGWEIKKSMLRKAKASLDLPAEAAPAAAQPPREASLLDAIRRARYVLEKPGTEEERDRWEADRILGEADGSRAAAAQPPPDLAAEVERLELELDKAMARGNRHRDLRVECEQVSYAAHARVAVLEGVLRDLLAWQAAGHVHPAELTVWLTARAALAGAAQPHDSLVVGPGTQAGSGGQSPAPAAAQSQAEGARPAREGLLEEALRLCDGALRRAVDEAALDVHAEDHECPEDDTCDCELALAVNKALVAASCALTAGPAEPQAEGAPPEEDRVAYTRRDLEWARREGYEQGWAAAAQAEGTPACVACDREARADWIPSREGHTCGRERAPRPETPPSHYADCDSRIGLECNCGAAPRPSTDKEGA
jgi:hypothetical protein